MQGSFEFTVNDATLRVEGDSCHDSLLDHLERAGIRDVKAPRGSENAGPDVLLAFDVNSAGRGAYRMVPAAHIPLPMAAGWTFWTADFLLNADPGHRAFALLDQHAPALPIEAKRAVAAALFEAYYRDDLHSARSVIEGYEGFSFRFGGFRGLPQAADTLFAEVSELRQRSTSHLDGNGFNPLRRRNQGAAVDPFQDTWSSRLQGGAALPQPISYVDARGDRFYRVATLAETQRLRQDYRNAVVIHSGLSWIRTDSKGERAPCLITTTGIAELRLFLVHDGEVEIGAENSLSLLQETLAGDFPHLAKTVTKVESRPLRNRLTIAEHLLESGRVPIVAVPLFLANARVRIATDDGERDVALETFYRTRFESGLRPNELMKSLLVPKPTKARRFEQCYVFGHGMANPCIIGAAGFQIELDKADNVSLARIALAGFDQQLPLKRCQAIETALLGQSWNEATIEKVAEQMLDDVEVRADAFADAEKRRRLAVNSLRRFFRDHPIEQLKATEVPIALPGNY